MLNILLLALAFFAFGEGIVIEPHTSEQIDPSVNGESILICSYEGVETCASTCYPAKVLVGDETVSPSDGSFTVEVQEEPIVIKNGGSVSINCEFMSQTPPCELLEPPPAIADDDLVDGCPDCWRSVLSQLALVMNENGETVCTGTRISTRIILTAAECVENAADLKIDTDGISNDFDVITSMNGLAILRLTESTSFQFPPCICSAEPDSSSYFFIDLAGTLNVDKCDLCENLTSTQVCTTLDRSTSIRTIDVGAGLFTLDEFGNLVLCGVLAGGTNVTGDEFDTSKGFNVIRLASLYNSINNEIEDCTG